MYYWLRIVPLMILDAILINISIYIALWLRFADQGVIPRHFYNSYVSLIPWFTVAILAALFAFKLYNRMWKYTSIGELYGIIKAVITGNIIVVLLIYSMHLSTLPRSVYIMSVILMFLCISGSRLGWRVMRENIIQEASKESKNTLIVGAGDAGAIVARELTRNSSLGLTPIGFIDDSSSKQGLTLYGIPVLGRRHNIPAVVRTYGVEEIIIAMPSAGGRIIREIIHICQDTPARLRIFQGGGDWLNNGNKIRDIELEDLLRREPVQLDLQEISTYIRDKTVLVTGGGGSIGSELCRQLCQHDISKLVIIDNCENNVFEIENELLRTYAGIDIEAELCDVKDKDNLDKVFAKHHPQIVFHAAAYKHVPLMERYPVEAFKNNVIGSKNIVEVSDKHSIETFVLISTDKAVRPRNVMGATKRIAELLTMEVNSRSNTKYSVVRFGNVLGSRGSVVPTFKRQIEEGGPITVTDPQMTRYFMTIPEAIQLVIQAGAMSRGGEIFVLDMGEPVKIMDLAKDLLKIYSYELGRDIEIEITGVRPGEKLFEELFTSREEMASTKNERIYVLNQDNQAIDILESIGEVTNPVEINNEIVKKWLLNHIKDYDPN